MYNLITVLLIYREICRYQKAKQRAEIKRAVKILNSVPQRDDGEKVVTI